MRWILDDGPLGHLAQANPSLAERWDPGYLLVAETTARSVLNGSYPGRESVAALLVPTGRPAPIDRFEVANGTASWEIFAEIHKDLEDAADLAEHESISWAQSEALDTVFVSADKGAIMIALAELGRERVASPFDLWVDLFQLGWLVDVEFFRLCDRSYSHAQELLQRKPKRITELRG